MSKLSPQTQRHIDQAKTATASGDTEAAAGHLADAYASAYVSGNAEDMAQIKQGFNEAMRTWPKRG